MARLESPCDDARMTRQCAILFVIALAACPKPAPAPTPPPPPPLDVVPDASSSADAAVASFPLDEDLPRLALRAVELYEEVARVFAAAGTDCTAAATKVRAMRSTYADVVAANAKVLHAGAAKALRAALEPHAARFDAAAKTIANSATMAECSDDREFTNAFDDLVGAP